MAIINQATKELQLKIVYYGPGKGGKTTNLEQVHANLGNVQEKGKLISLATSSDRTLVFRFSAHRSHGHQGLQDQVPALHRSRPGHLQHHPPTGACAGWTA